MPPITALLHTSNDARRLGRALETLLPCAELLIVDHDSTDATRRVARGYGARVLPANGQATVEDYLEHASSDWILCLDPSESITERLQATLFEWNSLAAESTASSSAFCFSVREQLDHGWQDLPEPETRLIPRNWGLWNGLLPAYDRASIPLEGSLLRIAFP